MNLGKSIVMFLNLFGGFSAFMNVSSTVLAPQADGAA